LLNGISTEENYIVNLAKFLKKYSSISRIDLLPYHTLGVKKWEALNLPYKLDDTALVSTEKAESIKKIFESEGFFTTLQ
jgi:pyruvate formate lyase activating enzyme